MKQKQSDYSAETQVRISLTVESTEQGRAILDHLVEERLVAGGNVIHAQALNWVGGKIKEEERLVLNAYTTVEKMPLIRARVEPFYDDAPPLSQYVIGREGGAVERWIERNVRE